MSLHFNKRKLSSSECWTPNLLISTTSTCVTSLSVSNRNAKLDVNVTDLQNQVAHSLTLLFRLSYTTTWTSFFNDFLALIQRNASQGKNFDPFSTQIFLRVLSMIDEEVADALYTFSKKAGDHRLNTEIKDRIRNFDVRNVTRLLFELMTAYQGDGEQEGLIRLCLSVIGQWIGKISPSPSSLPANHVEAWIDITLIVNDSYMTLVYRFLGHSGLRTAASETLANILSKKMNSSDKLQLITLLNLNQVINSLETDEDVEFSEALARLVNVQGLELTRIISEV
jgi:exportin-T